MPVLLFLDHRQRPATTITCVPHHLPSQQQQAPPLSLIAFGCYLLVLLASGALSFRTCPEDAKALQEVSEQHMQLCATVRSSFLHGLLVGC